jgi:hypothetical protein
MISSLNSLIYYMMTATNKRYSYLRVTVIRIDLHPVGEIPINTPHVFHARFAYAPGPYISRGPRRQSFASPHEVETGTYTQKKSWQSKTAGLTVVLDHLIPHPSRQPWSRVERFWPSTYIVISTY